MPSTCVRLPGADHARQLREIFIPAVRKNVIPGIMIAVVVCAAPQPLQAKSVYGTLKEGQAAYEKEDYDSGSWMYDTCIQTYQSLACYMDRTVEHDLNNNGYKEFDINFERDNEGNWFVNGDNK